MIALLLAVTAVPDHYQSSPERQAMVEPRRFNHWEADYLARLWSAMHQDFGEKYLYAPADKALPPPRPGEKRVVFLGDSITDLWDLARFFPGKPYVNRGIGGQVTAQMVLRFQQDVVDLKPAAVVILAGINDLHGALQRESDEGIEANWEAMADMAEAHHIKVVFGAILPVNNYTDNARDNFAPSCGPIVIFIGFAWLNVIFIFGNCPTLTTRRGRYGEDEDEL